MLIYFYIYNLKIENYVEFSIIYKVLKKEWKIQKLLNKEELASCGMWRVLEQRQKWVSGVFCPLISYILIIDYKW